MALTALARRCQLVRIAIMRRDFWTANFLYLLLLRLEGAGGVPGGELEQQARWQALLNRKLQFRTN